MSYRDGPQRLRSSGDREKLPDAAELLAMMRAGLDELRDAA